MYRRTVRRGVEDEPQEVRRWVSRCGLECALELSVVAGPQRTRVLRLAALVERPPASSDFPARGLHDPMLWTVKVEPRHLRLTPAGACRVSTALEAGWDPSRTDLRNARARERRQQQPFAPALADVFAAVGTVALQAWAQSGDESAAKEVCRRLLEDARQAGELRDPCEIWDTAWMLAGELPAASLGAVA